MAHSIKIKGIIYLWFYFLAFSQVMCSSKKAHQVNFIKFDETEEGLHIIESYKFDNNLSYFIIFTGQLNLEDIYADNLELTFRASNASESLLKIQKDQFFVCNWARLSGNPKDGYGNIAAKIPLEGNVAIEPLLILTSELTIELRVATSRDVVNIYLMQLDRKTKR